MDEIEYKLESGNPVLISHAISKLFESIKKKKSEQSDISKIAEFKLLLTKKDSADVTLSVSACQALVALTEDGLWDIQDALSIFTSSIALIKNHTVAVMIISRLLILDLKRDGNKSIYPFALHAPQHPFIITLTRDKHSWQTILSEMTFIMNHRDPQIKENGVKMLRAVFLYVLCNPSINSMNSCMQQVWRLLIKSKRGTRLQMEALLWLSTAEDYICVNTNYRILELAERALSERNREDCTALLPMTASLILQLLKNGSDPRPNFDTIRAIIDYCDNSIGNLMLTLMSKVVVSCPAIYLYSALQICIIVMKKMFCDDLFLNVLKSSILKWMAYPSVLCSDALDLARDIVNGMSAGGKTTNKAIPPNRLFKVFSYSDPCIQFHAEIVHSLSTWNENDISLWLETMSRVPTYLKDKCKLLIAGVLLQTKEPQVTESCCNILIDVCKKKKSFGSHVLSLVLHKLTKCKTSAESKCLLLAIPELAITKENVPIVTHTLDTLLSGDKQLKYFAIELYLKALEKEQRCYRFVSAAIIRLMKTDHSWYSDTTCARAMKYICENHPEHGETLVPLLSQILNRSTDSKSGTASALALGCISALCRASVIDICSTWRVLAPKMEKENRTIVLESLCELFSDITSYPPTQHQQQYDQLIENIVSKLWKCAIHNDVRVAEAAFKALSSFSLEHLSLKTLPQEFRRNLALPAAYAKTPIDAARKPEDVLPYVPGVCWIQMLQNVNKLALTAAGNFLISFITEEVKSFRSGMYNWPQGEPQNFKYLAEKSVIRAVGEYLRKSDKTDSNNHRIIIECLRIFANKYPKPLPNINWGFLKDTVELSTEAKQYTLSIACHQAEISSSAKSFIEEYMSTYKSLNGTNFIWKNEQTILYSNLEELCQALQPNVLKPFLEITLEHVIEKMNIDNEESVELFNCIMNAYAQALKHQEMYHANSTLLSNILEKLLERVDLTYDRFHSYFNAALQLMTEHLERMTSPKVWWEVTENKLKNAIAIRGEMILKKSASESTLAWLNETIDETATIAPGVQTYFLKTIQRILKETQFEKSSSTWILDLMTQIQGLSMESWDDRNEKLQFYCEVLFVSIISLSGVDSMLMKYDELITSKEVRMELFPQALTILSDKQEWKYANPQVMEWLNYMRSSTVFGTHKSIFHRSLICLRHNPYYKDVWMKYLSVETDIDV